MATVTGEIVIGTAMMIGGEIGTIATTIAAIMRMGIDISVASRWLA